MDDFISISPSPTLRTDQMDSITISIWGKPESFDDKNRFINIVNTTENVNYDLSILSNKIWFQNYYHVPPHISMHDTGDVVLNKWYHILVTINNTNNIANLYINGNKIAADTHAIHRPVNPNVTIGRHTTATTWCFEGDLDDIRIYNKVLNETEIKSLYNEGLCFETVYDTITIYDTVSYSSSYINYNEQIITSPFDDQGNAAAIYENIAAIGRAWEDKQSISNSGAAYVYEYNGTNWTQTGDLYNPAGATDDLFGFRVATDGNYIIVGTPGEGNGAAYIYTKSGDNWIEQARLKLDAGEIISNEIYAISSDIDGNTAVIGSGSAFAVNCNSTGSAYVYEFDGSNWIKTARLTADDGQAYDNFGTNVKVHGNTIVVGAEGICYNPATPGYAYVYEKVDGTWTQTAKLTAPDGVIGDKFGRTVCLYDNKIVVSAISHNNATGAAYFYEKVGNNWDFKEKILPNDITTGDAFGDQVSIWKNRLLAASSNNSNEYTHNGAAYIFEYNGTNWIEKHKFIPSEGKENYHYGRYNDMSGSSAILKAQAGPTHILKFNNVETIYDTIPVYDTTYVTVYDSISVTDTLIIDVELTDITPPNNINTIKVYPNPAKDKIFIHTGDKYSEMTGYTIKIINTLGNIVFESEVTQQLFEIDVSAFGQTGLYFIQIIDYNNQILEIRKLILE